MGFNNTAVTATTDAKGENIELDDLQDFATDDQVDDLIASLRRPGGLTPNPNAGNPGRPANIPNPGVFVAARAVDNLKTGCFVSRHFARTQRTLTADFLTAARLRTWTTFKKAEEEYEDPDEQPKLEKASTPKTLEFIDEFPLALRNFAGLVGHFRMSLEMTQYRQKPMIQHSERMTVCIPV